MDIDDFIEEGGLRELLELLLVDGHFVHEAEIGIVKKIIDQGTESLSGGQKDIFNKYIEPKFENSKIICKRCQASIDSLPINERYVLISTGYCPLCDYRLEKDERRKKFI